MKYNFDEIIERVGTNSEKWDALLYKKYFGTEDQDLLPLWVADMDFRSPQPIIDAFKERIDHGIFGYSYPLDSYYQAIIWWQETRHQWKIKPEWITPTSGIVPSLAFIIRSLSNEGDRVIIQQPVYYPFKDVIEKNNRILVNNSLKWIDGRYEMDFDDLEEKVKDPNTKLLILCSPHNPMGIVWSREEIQQLAEICLRNDVIVISDEIHNDLILPGNEHITYGLLGDDYANHSVVCVAPSKTFNIAGIQTSNLIIPNQIIKAKIDAEFEKSAIITPNLFGIVATTAAYSSGGAEWLDQLLQYLEQNADFIDSFLKANLPKVRYSKPQSTYLAWLDFREYGLSHTELERIIKEDAKVLLDGGSWFGPGGEGFMRVNFACPKLILEEALIRIARVMG